MSKKMRSSMTSFVAFVGVGKAGCKIAEEFKNLGYAAYFINSSAKDLSSIDAPKNMKYQIPFAQGTNGDRSLAKKYCKDYFDLIISNINSKLGNFTHIFFCFSAGGGTGSGISPLLIKNLINRTEDIEFGAICAFPADNESPQAKYNGYECSKELSSIQNLGNVYLINNNLSMFKNKDTDLDTINKLFADRFNATMLIVDYDTTGNIDESEMRAALSVSGCCTFADILPDGDKKSIKVDNMMIPLGKGSQYIIYSITDKASLAQEEVEDTFNKPMSYKFGNGTDNFVTVYGLPFPDENTNKLATAYTDDIEKIESIDEDVVDIIDIKFVNPLEKKRKNLAIATKVDRLIDELEDF